MNEETPSRPITTNIPPTYEELDAEIARQQVNMDLHLNGMVIARNVLKDLLMIRRYWDLYGRPGDQPDTPDNLPVTI